MGPLPLPDLQGTLPELVVFAAFGMDVLLWGVILGLVWRFVGLWR